MRWSPKFGQVAKNGFCSHNEYGIGREHETEPKETHPIVQSEGDLETLKGEETIAELANRFKVHPGQIRVWKNNIENELADRCVELIDLETMTGYAAEMQDIICEGSLAHRKTFIHGFVKDIRVTGGKAVLSYVPPDLPDKVEFNLEGVPRIVQYGGR